MELLRDRILAAFLAIGLSFIALSADARERDFILVHGAWVGEWYWDDLVSALEEAGHRAHAVSLKGHGKRASEGGYQVTIQDHAIDIVDAVNSHSFEDVILVGHSYGGRPVTAAWDLLRERVSQVVYVESVAPLNEDVISIPKDSLSLTFVMKNYPAWVETGMVPVPLSLLARYDQVLAPQSMASVYGEVRLQNGPLPETRGTYVIASDSRATVFRRYANDLHQKRGWDIREISGGHSIYGDGLVELLEILLTVAEQKP